MSWGTINIEILRIIQATVTLLSLPFVDHLSKIAIDCIEYLKFNIYLERQHVARHGCRQNNSNLPFIIGFCDLHLF